jgi:hypothetical protein
VEHGVPLAQVRDLLGHASITTTERYDNQTLANLQVAAAKLERGLGFEALAELGAVQTARTESGRYRRRRKFPDSFKIGATAERSASTTRAPETGANYLKESGLGKWLGGRDSSAPLLRSYGGSHRVSEPSAGASR